MYQLKVAKEVGLKIPLTCITNKPDSNRGFSQWNEIFGDPVIATAILDRILHHSTTINIKGNSYRLREKVKAGLIREPEVEES